MRKSPQKRHTIRAVYPHGKDPHQLDIFDRIWEYQTRPRVSKYPPKSFEYSKEYDIVLPSAPALRQLPKSRVDTLVARLYWAKKDSYVASDHVLDGYRKKNTEKQDATKHVKITSELRQPPLTRCSYCRSKQSYWHSKRSQSRDKPVAKSREDIRQMVDRLSAAKLYASDFQMGHSEGLRFPSIRSIDSNNDRVPSVLSIYSMDKSITRFPRVQSKEPLGVLLERLPSARSIASIDRSVTRFPRIRSKYSIGGSLERLPSVQSIDSMGRFPRIQSTDCLLERRPSAKSIDSIDRITGRFPNIQSKQYAGGSLERLTSAKSIDSIDRITDRFPNMQSKQYTDGSLERITSARKIDAINNTSSGHIPRSKSKESVSGSLESIRTRASTDGAETRFPRIRSNESICEPLERCTSLRSVERGVNSPIRIPSMSSTEELNIET